MPNRPSVDRESSRIFRLLLVGKATSVEYVAALRAAFSDYVQQVADA